MAAILSLILYMLPAVKALQQRTEPPLLPAGPEGPAVRARLQGEVEAVPVEGALMRLLLPLPNLEMAVIHILQAGQLGSARPPLQLAIMPMLIPVRAVAELLILTVLIFKRAQVVVRESFSISLLITRQRPTLIRLASAAPEA